MLRQATGQAGGSSLSMLGLLQNTSKCVPCRAMYRIWPGRGYSPTWAVRKACAFLGAQAVLGALFQGSRKDALPGFRPGMTSGGRQFGKWELGRPYACPCGARVRSACPAKLVCAAASRCVLLPTAPAPEGAFAGKCTAEGNGLCREALKAGHLWSPQRVGSARLKRHTVAACHQ